MAGQFHYTGIVLICTAIQSILNSLDYIIRVGLLGRTFCAFQCRFSKPLAFAFGYLKKSIYKHSARPVNHFKACFLHGLRSKHSDISLIIAAFFWVIGFWVAVYGRKLRPPLPNGGARY